MAAEERVTFCRICESLCGLVATVEDGQVVKLRPDRAHPLSRGYACPKGIAMTEVQNDPERVLHPLRRRPGGGFDRVGWDEALDDIGARLRAVLDARGPEAVAWYLGNPGAFGYAHVLWVNGFMKALGSPHLYGAGSQDVNNRFAASALLYGTPIAVPFPDLPRTDLLVVLGANPLVSHGSVLTAPRIREELGGIVRRGGRVVVVDPRRTETARAFEHVPIAPDADAPFLLALLHVLFAEALEDHEALERQATGVGLLRRWVAPWTPERAAGPCGVPADEIRGLARDLAAAPAAAVYGRTGSCLGRHGTLVAYLIDALNLATGNLDRPGGSVFGDPAVDLDALAQRLGLATYGQTRSRIGGFPDVLGNLPASLLPREITTPGPRQVQALFVSAGNPVLSVPDGDALEDALGRLHLSVSLDLYVNETNRHADYVLPAATWLEREDVPLALLPFHVTPFVQHSDAVVPPRGEAREEWEVVDALARRVGTAPYPLAPLRWLARLGVRPTPRRLLDLLLRTGPRRLSLAALRRRPHGIVTAPHVPTGVLARKVRHRGGRARLDLPEIAAELARLAAAPAPDPAFPLRLIGLRELRSHNSWMHNAPLLMRGRSEPALRIHPDDAGARGLGEGDRVRIASKSGEVGAPVRVTDEMRPGTVALPHGWGHAGGWSRANAAGGPNVNALASSAPEDLEPLAGMAHLNGIPVEVTAAAQAAAPA